MQPSVQDFGPAAGLSPEGGSARPERNPAERLTVQEQACLRLVARRLSSREIAQQLGIAKTSVDTYCNRARRKLGVADRYAAARLLSAQEAQPIYGGAAITVAAPRPGRTSIALAAGMVVATMLGLASLLAGMSALDALRPPDGAARLATEEPAPEEASASDG